MFGIELDEWFDMEILGNPKFWISAGISSLVTIGVISAWGDKVPGAKGFMIMGIVGSIFLAYFLTIRSINNDG